MSDFELDETLQRPHLRVELLTPAVQVTVGEPVSVTLEIHNTSAVIEQLDVRLLGLMAEEIVQTPTELTLFPEETIRVVFDLRFHPTLPAGTHEGLLVVAGRSGASVPAERLLTVEVPERSRVEMQAEPPIRTGGKRGGFELLVDNTGNTELDLLLQARDANRILDLSLSDRQVDLRVDQTAYVLLIARGQRPWVGSPVEHTITIEARGHGLEESTEVRFRQKPRLTAGIITLLTLALIVLLWTLAMYFGVLAAMETDPTTKSVPEAFMTGNGREDLDPATVGGTVTGTVTAASTGQPVERVTVEAFDARGQLVTATATDDDGSYELAALLPARYRLRLRAPGFEEQWWPGSPTAATADELVVAAAGETEAEDSVLTGLPGGIGGQAVAGDGEPAAINVEITGIDLLEEEPPILLSADDAGLWSAEDLTAPATYRITYRAAGFAPVEVTQELAAGEQLALNATRLPAAAGAISGTVTDRNGIPLGGVEVTARDGDVEAGTTTPTSGEVGAFSFNDLETPGTFLLTFEVDGFASETQGVPLGPGESVSGLTVVLSDATGVITGQASSSDGGPLGGVTVTVSGGGQTLSTDTLTSGAVGSFRLSGLPLPGTYSVSFDIDGFARETLQVSLGADNPEATANAVLTSSVGRITGQVLDDVTGDPIAGAQVEVSDGSTVRATTSASAPASQRGRFSIGDLAPGAYTITATTEDGDTLTVLETLGPAQTVDVALRVDTS